MLFREIKLHQITILTIFDIIIIYTVILNVTNTAKAAYFLVTGKLIVRFRLLYPHNQQTNTQDTKEYYNLIRSININYYILIIAAITVFSDEFL